MTRPSLLLIETLPALAKVYQAVLTGAGYAVTSAGSEEDAVKRCQTLAPRIALLDLRQGGMRGLDVMRACLRVLPSLRLIVVAANGAAPRVVEAMRAGAYDYIVTPIDEKRLLSAIARAMDEDGGTGPTDPSTRAALRPTALPSFIAASPTMRRLADTLAVYAKAQVPLYLHGENGTGKSLCAELIHAHAAVPGAPLRVLRGPQTNFERLGPVFQAGPNPAGTLVIDDVAGLPPMEQSRLLEFLDVHAAHTGVPRIIATCSGPGSGTEIPRGLRPDLFHRLRGLTLTLPPLRERPEDIQALTAHYLPALSTTVERTFKHAAPEAMARLSAHDWPGNVRELINVLRQAVALHDGPVLESWMLPDAMAAGARADTLAHAADAPHLSDLVGRPLTEVERLIIEATIAREAGSLPRAAAVLGLSPSTLYRKREAWQAQDETAAAARPNGRD